MNENIDLTKILEGCPVGMEFYHVVYGRVWLTGICLDDDCPIRLSLHNGPYTNTTLTKKGTFSKNYGGECLLFPSKNQRDWSKFVPPYKFKDGDIVATPLGSQVFILKRMENDVKGYCYIGYYPEYNKLLPAGLWYFSRLTTEEEKRKFFDAIKSNGYKWNAETKTLEKLVKPKFKVGDKIVNGFRKYIGASVAQGVISEITDDKYIFTDGSYISISDQDSWKLVPDRFDPKTLQPFDKVLVRDHCDSTWLCRFFSHIMNLPKFYKYATTDSFYKYCIPYNDDTKHLIGTTEEAPEYYRYWEE